MTILIGTNSFRQLYTVGFEGINFMADDDFFDGSARFVPPTIFSYLIRRVPNTNCSQCATAEHHNQGVFLMAHAVYHSIHNDSQSVSFSIQSNESEKKRNYRQPTTAASFFYLGAVSASASFRAR